MPAFDAERAALILLDALALGDEAAAEKWDVSVRTVRNHRDRLESDAGFAAFFRAKLAKASRGWASVRLRFLRKAITKLEELVEKAGPDQIRDVSEAVKTVGELQVVSDALNVGNDASPEGEEPATHGEGSPTSTPPIVH